MTRPTIAAVDPHECTMTLAFAGGAGKPPRYFTLPLRARVITDEAARMVAEQQLAALPDADLAVMAEAATPDADVARDLPAMHDLLLQAGFIQTVQRVHTAVGPVFCPRCAHKIGRAESPHIEYVDRCSACGRALSIQRDGDIVIVSAQEKP